MSIDWRIILKSRNEQLTVEEQAALDGWLSESERNKKLYREVKAGGKYEPSGEQLAQWRSGFELQLKDASTRRKRVRRLRIGSASAAACIMFAVVTVWFAGRGGSYTIPEQKILLTTSTGEVIEWDRIVADATFDFGVPGSREEKSFTIVDSGIESELAVMTTIYIPSGKDFYLEMGDGTKVWLNSETELKFPLQFGKDRREVILKGEAYFEVAHDLDKPFFVRTADASVEVLGTSFNVSSYENDAKMSVALLEGSVRFNATGQQITLTPGEVVSLESDGRFSVATDDVGAIASWRTGVYDYRDMPLEELVAKLGRWYGVEFRFSDESAKELRFSGAVSRSRDLDYMLDMISKTTDIEFSVRKGVVSVGLKN
ncbi:FecR domain-containing protein [Alistipes sp. OttesenSCG-928-B03]|nr:FecR domain-containing protein [Alistipes sp. OttesenSCG-928-B03]